MGLFPVVVERYETTFFFTISCFSIPNPLISAVSKAKYTGLHIKTIPGVRQ